MGSANLTLRQRQQQRRAEEELGDDSTRALNQQRLILSSSSPRQLSPPGRKNHKQRRPTAKALALIYAGASVVFLTLCVTLYAHLSPWYLGNLMSIPQLRRRNRSFTVGFSIVLNDASEKKPSRGRCVPPTVFKSKEEFISEHELLPDLNGLDVPSLSESAEFIRAVRIDRDRRIFSHDRMKELETMNVHPGGVGRRYEDDFEYSTNHECRRNNWRSRKFPNCNSAHELFNLDRTNEYEAIEFKGAGAFRNSWLFESKSDQFVVKSLRLKSGLNADYSMMYQIHKEAIVMERLTSSPRIVDIFGYCGTTVVAEYMNRQITGDIVLGSEDWEGYAGWMNQKDLDKLQKNDVHPMNNLTIDKKLDLAIVMAESIADIHGFEGGVIVHVRYLANCLKSILVRSRSHPLHYLRLFVLAFDRVTFIQFSGYKIRKDRSNSTTLVRCCFLRRCECFCVQPNVAILFATQTTERFWTFTLQTTSTARSIVVTGVRTGVQRNFVASIHMRQWIPTGKWETRKWETRRA
jgi:hypothetical protein